MTAELVKDVTLRMPRPRGWVKPSVLAEAGVPAYREVVTVRAGDSVVVDVPFPVELRPAELVGPRRRS